MSTVKERLLEYIKASRMSVAEFERKIGVSSGYVNSISKSIQPDKLERISDNYTDLNTDWLLLGKGLMKRGKIIGIDISAIVDNSKNTWKLENCVGKIEVPEAAKEIVERIWQAGLKSEIDNPHMYIDPRKTEQLLTVNKTANKNDIAKRLQKIIQISKLSNQQFAEYIGVKVGVLSAILSGDRPIENNIYEKICSVFNINENWFLLGKGSMSKSMEESGKPEEQIASALTSCNTVNYKLVPLLNLDAVGGMHSTNSEVGDSECIDRLIPFTDAQDGDVALMVSGNSMDPTCPSGSKVLIREVPQWNEYFGYGNLFVLLLTDGRRILKEVQKYTEDSKNYILCRSHNDRYPEEELPKSMIAGVWKVIKILNERGW